MEDKGILQSSHGIAASTDENLLVRHSQSCMKTMTKAKPKGDYSITCWGCLSQQWMGGGIFQEEGGGFS